MEAEPWAAIQDEETGEVTSSSDRIEHPDLHPRIRKYERGDEVGVRNLCCDVAFLGNPIDPIFGDRELFADLHTKYYLEREPESVFVAEHKGSMVGYVLGCRNVRRFHRYFIFKTIPSTIFRVAWRYFLRYNKTEKRYAKWLIFRSLREAPRTPRNSAHLHINVEKGYRNKDTGKRLAEELFKYFKENGVRRAYGGVFSFEKRRKPDFYEKVMKRIGSQGRNFRVYDKKETTVWKGLVEGKVYLLRIVRDLD